jgi:alkylated DNA repair dioxygenase AlkB
LREKTGFVFNSALANLYRDGNDSMGWHSDDERELGIEPVIASISLGAKRDFHLRRKNRGTGRSGGCARSISLPHGGLLLMSGTSQRDWQHALPKRRRISEPRINLTFRLIIT